MNCKEDSDAYYYCIYQFGHLKKFSFLNLKQCFGLLTTWQRDCSAWDWADLCLIRWCAALEHHRGLRGLHSCSLFELYRFSIQLQVIAPIETLMILHCFDRRSTTELSHQSNLNMLYFESLIPTLNPKIDSFWNLLYWICWSSDFPPYCDLMPSWW